MYLHLPNYPYQRSAVLKELSSLIHLRNITLRNYSFNVLPFSVGKLPNLGTLDVRGAPIDIVPQTLYLIQTLRHLCTAKPLIVHSSAIGSLTRLQTSKLVKAGSWIQAELAKLSSLGRLYIIHVSAVQWLHSLIHFTNSITSSPCTLAPSN